MALEFILGNEDLFNIILPFVLMFTILFAVFQASKVLGGKKNIDAILSLVLAFFLVRNQDIIQVINRFLPNVSLAIIVILMILLVIGVFLGEYEWAHGFKGLAAVAGVIIVLWIFGAAYWANFGVPNYFSNWSSETKGIIIFIAILIIIVFFVTRESKDNRGDRLEKFGEAIFKK